MLTLNLGPLAMPTAPLLLLLSVWLGLQCAARLVRADAAMARTVKDHLFHASLIGLLAARLAFVLQSGASYSGEPWRALDIRDGGWLMLPGVLAAALFLAWRALRAPEQRQALGVGAMVATMVWAAGSLGLGLHRQVDVPDVPLQSLPAVADAAPRHATLAQLAQGQPTVIVLWASWCGVCHRQMPYLAAAQQRQAEVQFLFINQGETPAQARQYLAQEQLALRGVWLDAASRTGPAVGSRGLPTTLFYNAQGELTHRQIGPIGPAALAQRLQTLRPRSP